jgi:hypothetical protein
MTANTQPQPLGVNSMPPRPILTAFNRLFMLVLLLALFVGSACAAGTPRRPPPGPAHTRATDQRNAPYLFASTQGDTIVLEGDSLQWERPYETLSMGHPTKVEKVVPKVTHATELYFSIHTKAHVAVLVRPVHDIGADTTLSPQSLLAEYADRSLAWMSAYPLSWYPRAFCRIRDSTLAHVVWIGYGAVDSADTPIAVKSTGRVIGELIVDPVRNRILWTRGRVHGR